MVQLRRHRGELGLAKWGRVDTPAKVIDQGQVTDPIKLGEAISSLFSRLGVRKPGVTASISGQQIFIRRLTVPLMPRNEMVQAIKYQLQGLLPIPSAEIRFDFMVPNLNARPAEDKLMEVLVVATRHSVIEGLKESIIKAGAIPLVLDIEPLAISRLLRIGAHPLAAPPGIFLVNIGRTITQLSLFEQGVLWFNRTLTVPNDQSVDFPSVAREVSTEVWRTLEYYQSEHPEAKVESILLTGEATRFRDFSAALVQVNIPVKQLDPLAGIRLEQSVAEEEIEELKASYGVALGLAARIDSPVSCLYGSIRCPKIPFFRGISGQRRFDRGLGSNQINLISKDNRPDSIKKHKILIGAFSLFLFFCLPSCFCYRLSQKLHEQESRYRELEQIFRSRGMLTSQEANQGLIAAATREKERQLSQWQIDRDQWSKALSGIYKTIPAGCHLQEVHQHETGIKLLGQARSYPDLAQFIAAIEELKMFTEVNLIKSKYDPLAQEMLFELQCNSIK